MLDFGSAGEEEGDEEEGGGTRTRVLRSGDKGQTGRRKVGATNTVFYWVAELKESMFEHVGRFVRLSYVAVWCVQLLSSRGSRHAPAMLLASPSDTQAMLIPGLLLNTGTIH
jgi:hypothetical protein